MRGVEQIPWLYDAGMAVQDRLGLARWRNKLVGRARGRVLEVGCGTGRNLPRYAPDATVVGLDPSLDALLAAKKRAPGALLVAASAEALPFADGVFDAVVSSLVFCSVPNPDAGLAEVRRVLTPDGTLAMMEHVRSTGAIGARIQDAIQPVWTWVLGGCHPNRATEAAVERAGFAIDAASRKAKGVMRLFVARKRPDTEKP